MAPPKVQKTEQSAQAKKKTAPDSSAGQASATPTVQPSPAMAPPSLPAAGSVPDIAELPALPEAGPVSDAAAPDGPATIPEFLDELDLPEEFAAMEFGETPGAEAGEFMNHIVAMCIA